MAIEEVYTNSFSGRLVAWVEVGVSPYLQDTDADYIRTNTDLYSEGDWIFPNSAGSGTINEVKIRLESYVTILDCGIVSVYVWDGSSWIYAGSFYPAQNLYTWYELDVSAILNTWAKINGTMVYVVYGKELTGYCYVRRLTRKIDYTPVGGPEITKLFLDVGNAQIEPRTGEIKIKDLVLNVGNIVIDPKTGKIIGVAING